VTRLLTQGEIEQTIMALSAELEDQTTGYSLISDEAAEAEADYKQRAARAWIGVAADPSIKMTAGERDRRVDLHCADEYRRWQILAARQRATREALLSLRTRIDAMRTLAANVRAQT